MHTDCIYIVFYAMFVGIVTGLVVGKFHERIQWNKLIQSGILPKPRIRRK